MTHDQKQRCFFLLIEYPDFTKQEEQSLLHLSPTLYLIYNIKIYANTRRIK